MYIQYTWINVSFIQSHLLAFTMHKYACTCTHSVQLQFYASISQYRPRVIFKYSFWQPEECVRPKRQAIMYACIPASNYCSKVPAKYSRQRDVTIIISTHVVINYHYHNHLTRRLEEKWITDLVMILKCPKVSCTRYCIIFYGELYYYLHFERSSNFLWKSMKIEMGVTHLCTVMAWK